MSALGGQRTFDAHPTPTSSYLPLRGTDTGRAMVSLRNHAALRGDDVEAVLRRTVPTPPLRGFDTLGEYCIRGGEWDCGFISASTEVSRYEWAFACHFLDDPILPGSLLLDSMFQLTGVFAGLLGFHGRGRALKADRTRFLAELFADGENHRLQD